MLAEDCAPRRRRVAACRDVGAPRRMRVAGGGERAGAPRREARWRAEVSERVRRGGRGAGGRVERVGAPRREARWRAEVSELVRHRGRRAGGIEGYTSGSGQTGHGADVRDAFLGHTYLRKG